MILTWQLVVVAIISYLLGSINLSIILGKLMGKGDIREQGSGNAGTTNTLRTLGKLPAAAVLIWDILKGVIAVLLAKAIISSGVNDYSADVIGANTDYAMAIAAIMAVLGHNFPIYFGFKGGKGVATSLGVIIAIEWPIALACAVFAIILIILTKMVSFGSVVVAILYPILTFCVGTAFTNRWVYLGLALLLAASVLIRHKGNIKRILNGTENKLGQKKTEEANTVEEETQK